MIQSSVIIMNTFHIIQKTINCENDKLCLAMSPKGSDTWASRGDCLLPLYCSSDPDGARA